MLPLLLTLAFAGTEFQPITLATDLTRGYQVLAVDLNRDGRTDLIALASGLDHLDWFENPGPGGGTWQRHVLASGIRELINVAALDLDRDGIPELLVAHEFSNIPSRSVGTVSVLRHKGDPRQAWSREDIENRPTSHRLKVANGRFINAPLAHPTAEAPQYRGAIPLVEYSGTPLAPRVISAEESGVMHGLAVFDYDGDGRDDIFTAAFSGLAVYLGQKDGSYKRQFLHEGSPLPWPKSGSSEIALLRLARGKKAPFVLASIDHWHGNELAIYMRQGDKWVRELLDSNFEEGHTLLPIDLNGDGVEELIYGSRKQGGTLRVAEYEKASKKWKTRSVADGQIGTSSCVALDANQDRRPDFACIGGASKNLLLFLNPRR